MVFSQITVTTVIFASLLNFGTKRLKITERTHFCVQSGGIKSSCVTVTFVACSGVANSANSATVALVATWEEPLYDLAAELFSENTFMSVSTGLRTVAAAEAEPWTAKLG